MIGIWTPPRVPRLTTGWARNRAESEFPNLWDGLVGSWQPQLGPTGVITLPDRSGYGNHGTLNGSMTNDDWVVGPKGYALDFDGTNDYISAPATSSVQITGNLTLVARVTDTLNDAGGSNGILTKTVNSPGVAGYGLTKQSNLWKFWTTSGTVQYSVSNTTSTDALPHFLAGVRTNGTNRLWVDGILQTSSQSPGLTDSGAEVVIGRYYSNQDNYYFQGRIDFGLIYSRALSASEILALYQGETPLITPRRQWCFTTRASKAGGLYIPKRRFFT